LRRAEIRTGGQKEPNDFTIGEKGLIRTGNQDPYRARAPLGGVEHLAGIRQIASCGDLHG
jgi:hypothetical protein